METIEFTAIASVAFFGSLGHCIGMCGGFVLAYTASKVDNKWSSLHQGLAHSIYNIGRVFSYVILGALFGGLGAVISFSKSSEGVLFGLVGVLMILMGLSLMGKIKFLQNIEAGISQTNIFKKLYRKILLSSNMKSFFFLGMLNGFIPCGLVYFFATAAVATASPFYGAVLMAVFGVMTIPALFSIGMLSGFLNSLNYRKFFITIASLLVILYGALTFYKGVKIFTDSTIKTEKRDIE